MSEHNKRRLSSQVDNGSQPKRRRASETDAGGSTQQDQGHGTLSTQERNEDRSETPDSTADAQYLYSHEFRQNYGEENATKKISTISINADGLVNNFGKIHDYLVQLAYPWHIIGVSETHLNMKHDVSRLNIAGYNLITENRKTGGGGVALYVHENVKYKRQDKLKLQVPVREDQAECNSLFIEILREDGKNIIVGVIYKPSAVSKGEFQKSLEETFKKIEQENKISYIMGDFNISFEYNHRFRNLGRPDHNILISCKTHFPKNSASGTVIDNIFTNAHSAHVQTTQGVLITDISEHLPLFQVSEIEISRITWTKDSWVTDKIRELQKKMEETHFNYIRNRTNDRADRYHKAKGKLEKEIKKAKQNHT